MEKEEFRISIWLNKEELEEVDLYISLLTQEKWAQAKYPSYKRGKVSRNQAIKELIFFALDILKMPEINIVGNTNTTYNTGVNRSIQSDAINTIAQLAMSPEVSSSGSIYAPIKHE
jgi:hypothetical protein